jgi:three-Cys-motif partner protein
MYDYLTRVDDGLLMRRAGPWAAEKLDYLRRYIEVFETSMRNKWPVRNYIDLLAGPGKNKIRETKEILLGSPLIAVTTQYPFTGYYFVDADESNTKALGERCTASSVSNLHIWTGDCNDLVDQVVRQLKPGEHQSLNLAFLDPEGLELRWQTVAKIAGIRRMDLIINYPQGGLNRMMAKTYQAANETLVDLFFGTRDWRTIYAEFKNQRRHSLHRELIDLYKARLRQLGYQEVKVGDEAWGDEPLMRSTQRNAPLYRLIFASKNPLGDKFWHEVTRRNLYGQRRLLDA